MKISQLAKLADVPSKTIRYYEDIELLPKATRDYNGYRAYNRADVEPLIFIRRCRELKIPLEHIKTLIQVQSDKDSSCEEVDSLIEQQLTKVRQVISELTLLEKSLFKLSKLCPNNKVGDCEILKNLHSINT